jgi:hypothetical protein
MTRLPWDPAEIGTHEDDLDHVADRLTRYAESASDAPSIGLVDRIQSALDDEPIPAAPWWRGGGVTAWRAPVRMFAAAAVLVLGVVAGLALGQLSGLVQEGGTGSSPAPITSPSTSPSPTPSPTLSPSPSDSPSSSPSPSGSPVSSARLITPNPTASPDDDAAETPDPDDDSGGNSGPGGGGDNSGPGSGDD